jgi:outer membrane biosynthesis protein TonB
MDARQKRRERLNRILRIATPVAIVLALGVAVWRFAGDTAGERREAPQVPTVILTPPPPPPPPPTPKPPEPQKTVQTEVPTPQPTEQPKSDAPKQLTINGPAQAGSDSFGVGAGAGGGSSVNGDPNGTGTGGGGFAEAAYRRQLASALQAAIQADDRASRLVFAAQVRVWVSPEGRVSKVTIAKSTGDARTDGVVVTALMQAEGIDAPPPQLRFPALVALRGRRT